MKIQTTRFGEVDFSEEELLCFPEGILGFESLKQYLLLSVPDLAPLKWLQSVEKPAIAFVVCDPTAFAPEYRIQASKEDLRVIAVEDASRAFVFTILTVVEDPEETTANLKGPLVLNLEKNLGKQIVLVDDGYPVRFRIHEGLAARQTA